MDIGEPPDGAGETSPVEDTASPLESEPDAELAMCYEILEVSSESSDEEVKSAYRRVSKEYHPDRFGADLEKKAISNDLFRQINAAYRRIQASRQT